MKVSNLFRVHPQAEDIAVCDEFPWKYLVGIEIELEAGYKRSIGAYVSSPHWDMKGDGSLRYNGVELVSRPVGGASLDAALTDLSKILASLNATASMRTSVHCHVDFTNSDMKEVCQFLCGFALFECILFSASGKDRYWNMYSPGLSFCYNQVRLANEIVQLCTKEDFDGVRQKVHTWNKYSGINLRSLEVFGTVEVRSHSGTTEPEEVREWVKMLLQLREYTRTRTCTQMVQDAAVQGHLSVFPECGYPYTFYLNNCCNAAEIAAGEDTQEAIECVE